MTSLNVKRVNCKGFAEPYFRGSLSGNAASINSRGGVSIARRANRYNFRGRPVGAHLLGGPPQTKTVS